MSSVRVSVHDLSGESRPVRRRRLFLRQDNDDKDVTMSRRYKSSTMKFRVPLSVPGSRYVEHCYGMHGKGYAHAPPRSSSIELILINHQRQLWRVEGFFPEPHTYVTDALGIGGEGWKILGWRMTDDSMPHGDYDAVDPELAQFDHLPVPNAHEPRPLCSAAFPAALDRAGASDG